MDKRLRLIPESVENKVEVDRISEMPDKIVADILSLLSLKESGATSTLSKRFRYVWASSKNLNFDADGTVRRYHWERNPEMKDLETRKYVDWVNHVLEQHRDDQEDVERFRVCFFGIDKRFTASSIDRWIQFAMKKRVRVLELNFLVRQSAEKYTFPDYIKRSSEYIGFEPLRVLRFERVNVTGDIIEYLLLNCPCLEKLSVYKANNLVQLGVVGQSVALKCLDIRLCGDLKRIEIRDAANLISFSYSGRPIELVLINVPLLIEISISYFTTFIESIRLAFSHLSCCINHLQTLMLDIQSIGFQVYNENYPVLPNLKHLELIVCVDSCRSTFPILAPFHFLICRDSF